MKGTAQVSIPDPMLFGLDPEKKKLSKKEKNDAAEKEREKRQMEEANALKLNLSLKQISLLPQKEKR